MVFSKFSENSIEKYQGLEKKMRKLCEKFGGFFEKNRKKLVLKKLIKLQEMCVFVGD